MIRLSARLREVRKVSNETILIVDPFDENLAIDESSSLCQRTYYPVDDNTLVDLGYVQVETE